MPDNAGGWSFGGSFSRGAFMALLVAGVATAAYFTGRIKTDAYLETTDLNEANFATAMAGTNAGARWCSRASDSMPYVKLSNGTQSLIALTSNTNAFNGTQTINGGALVLGPTALNGGTAGAVTIQSNLAGVSVIYEGTTSNGSIAGTAKANVFTAGQQFKAGPWYDVMAYGATGDGVTDDAVAIAAAITACPSGGTVYVPSGTYMVSTGLTINKPLILAGAGISSTIKGAGITILTITNPSGDDAHIDEAPGQEVRDITISDPSGNASTVGINIVSDFQVRLRGVNLIGKTGTNAGTGLLFTGGICSDVSGCWIAFWNLGVRLLTSATILSNANEFRGCVIWSNNTGVKIVTAQSVSFHGCTIENNVIGIDGTDYACNIVCTGTWHENASGGNIIVKGSYIGSGNMFWGADANEDIILLNTSSTASVSTGDYFTSGITNNGTGIFSVLSPTSACATTGTGTMRVGTAAQLEVANTWTAQNVFNGADPTIVRKSGSAAGVDEIQISHDGSDGYITQTETGRGLYFKSGANFGLQVDGYGEVLPVAGNMTLGADANGWKQVVMQEIAEPANPTTANYGTLFLKDNGAGKTQLCIRFSTGATQVIATEP